MKSYRYAAAAALILASGLYPPMVGANDVPRFAIDAAWPKDLPGDWITGQLGGVCIDAKGTTSTSSTAATSPRKKKETSSRRRRSSSSIRPATCFPRGAIRRWCRARSTAASSTATATSGSPATTTASSRSTTGRQAAAADRHSAASSIRPTAPARARATTPPRISSTSRRHPGRSGQRRRLCRRRLRQPARGRVRFARQVPAAIGPPGDPGRN